ncbi:MAG: helix-turn-helix transcriptional regulator [Chitinophagaceae bacterium]
MKTIPVRHITAAHKEQRNTGRFSIRELQPLTKGGDLIHDLHKHDFYFVLAVQKGKGIHEIDFVQYKIHDNTVFILRPGQVHRLELKAGAAGFLLEFDLAFYQPKNTITEQRWRKASGKNYCAVEAARFMKLHSFLSNIFKEISAMQEGYSEAIKASLDLFFIEYIRQSRNPKSIATIKSSYTQERFEELVRLLETNIGQMKNVSQYAGLLNLSPYQLNAIAKQSAGKTVSELINEQIVLEAKRYLLATSGQVKDIADNLGYEDVSYFIRFFKKQTGHSPEAFRKNFK